GPYRLIRRIGGGGMGEVYLAEDTRLGVARQVAIKMVRTEADSQAGANETERLFKREMQAIARLDHPYILPLYDFGEERSENVIITYMVMPFRSAGSLADWLNKRDPEKPLNPEEAAHFISQAAQALQYAHAQGLVHQDVKPANFLIRERSDQPLPDIQLSDFGIVKITTATTISQNVRGTPSSMAPEQWNGHPVPATDQYALAVMAYWLLTRQFPFKGTMQQVLLQHFEVQPHPPSTLNPAVSPALDLIIRTALQKSPEERFASVTAFSNAFVQATQLSFPPLSVSSNGPGAVNPTLPASREKGQAMLTPALPVPAPNAFRNEAMIQPPPFPTANTERIPFTPPIPGPLPPRRQRTNMFLLLGLVALLILASAGGVTLVLHQGQVNVQGTATASIQTRQAETSAQATMAAQETATANARLTATAIVNACPSYIQQCGSFTPSLSDPLQGPRNWIPGSNTTVHGDCRYVNDALQVSDTAAGFTFECAGLQNFSNFVFEVHMMLIRGDCGGIMIQFNPNNGQGYQFIVCSGGTYTLYKYTSFAGSSSSILTRGLSQAIKGPGDVNTLAIAFTNGSISLYVNQQTLNSAGDDNFTNGEIALLAADRQNTTTVNYTDARVWA
ncbi:MAG TPA: serine/threonine-protein kinase, partial [Ktedonobacteraceae bacterium]|nr:serine/threonine-protein kinase [Ktedonobacteraceae bacterium]